MLRFGRILTRHVAAASSADFHARSGVQRIVANSNRGPVAPSAHQRFLERHKVAVETLDRSNLFNLTDSLEFVGKVSYDALGAVINLVKSDPSRLEAFTDHRLSVLILAAGRKSESLVYHQKRQEYLKFVWDAVKNLPNAGIESLNSYLDTQLLLGQDVSVVDSLDYISSKNLQATVETYECFVKKFCKDSNLHGVVEIIREIKANDLPLSQSVVESWIECLVQKGAPKDAETVLNAFKSTLEPCRLQVAVARGYARNAQFDAVRKTLADLPVSRSADTNTALLDAVVDLFSVLVDGKCADAGEIIQPYLPQQLPALVLSKIRRNLDLGLASSTLYELESALTYIHLVEGNQQLTQLFVDTIYEEIVKRFAAVMDKKENLEPFISALTTLAAKIRNSGAAHYPMADILRVAAKHHLPTQRIYNAFIDSGEFAAMKGAAEHENQVIHALYPMVANVLHELNKETVSEETFNHLVQLFEYLHFSRKPQLVNAVVNQPVPFLKRLLHRLHNATPLASALVAQMLTNDQLDRLEELMNHKLDGEKDLKLFANRVINPLIRQLKSPKFDESRLATVARVIAAGFGPNNSGKSGESAGGATVAAILSAQMIPEPRVDKLVKLLVDEPRVTISSHEIKSIDAKLREINLPHRADLVKYLKRKSPTYQRWQTTDNLADLEQEAAALANNQAVPGLLVTLYEVILRKAADKHDIAAILRTLPKFYEQERKNTKHDVKVFRRDINRAFALAFLDTLERADWPTVDELWTLKQAKNPEQALLYSLTLCHRKKLEEAEEVLKSLKASAMNLQLSHFNSVGSSVTLRNVDEADIDQFLKILSKQFNIKSTWKAKLKTEAKLRKLKTLLDEKRTDDAFNLSVETSEEVGFAFGAFELIGHALETENQALIKKMKSLIVSVEDINTFILTFGVALLERGDKRGVDLLKSKVEYVPSKKLAALTDRLHQQKRAEVMHLLFGIFNTPENSALELEDLLRKTEDLYEKAGNAEGLRKLFNEAKASSMPINAKLKSQFESALKKLEAHSPEPTEAPGH